MGLTGKSAFGRRLLPALLALPFLAGQGVAGECGTFEIVDHQPLRFGTVAIRSGASGGVVLTPGGEVLGVGDVLEDIGAEPARIRLCGPPGRAFRLRIEPSELDIGSGQGTPHVVRDLEAAAPGVAIEKRGAGIWDGAMGPRGEVEIVVGATLMLQRHRSFGSRSGPMRFSVEAID